MEKRQEIYPVLTVTGSDSTGGSGVQADIKTITALGGYAVSAITSVTMQNTLGIQEFFDLPANIVSGQIEAICDDIQPVAVKIGMLRSVGVVDAIAEALEKSAPQHVVYAPIVVSSRNEELMAAEVIRRVRERLLRHCTLFIVNPQAASCFLPSAAPTFEGMLRSARDILETGCRAILLQGVALPTGTVADVLLEAGGDAPACTLPCGAMEQAHGAGSLFSAAATTLLGRGYPLAEAVEKAKGYAGSQSPFPDAIEGRGGQLYRELLRLIALHYKESNDVRYYADRLRVTARYLAQVTKRLAGRTPKALIDDHLLRQAELLLGSTDKTVQEIAYELGFRSQAHFTRFFKKTNRQTPSGFRRSSYNK